MDLTLRLVRHGRTKWNEERRYAGHCDIGLSLQGRTDLEALTLPETSYASVVSSDLRRCRETAAVIGVEPMWERAMREFDFGAIEGRTWDELDAATQQAMIDHDGFVAPGGESVAAFAARIDSFVAGLSAGTHLVITHGGVIHELHRREGLASSVSPGEWVDLTVSRR